MVDPAGNWLEVTRIGHNRGKIHDTPVATFALTWKDGRHPADTAKVLRTERLEIPGSTFRKTGLGKDGTVARSQHMDVISPLQSIVKVPHRGSGAHAEGLQENIGTQSGERLCSKCEERVISNGKKCRQQDAGFTEEPIRIGNQIIDYSRNVCVMRGEGVQEAEEGVDLHRAKF